MFELNKKKVNFSLVTSETDETGLEHNSLYLSQRYSRSRNFGVDRVAHKCKKRKRGIRKLSSKRCFKDFLHPHSFVLHVLPLIMIIIININTAFQFQHQNLNYGHL